MEQEKNLNRAKYAARKSYSIEVYDFDFLLNFFLKITFLYKNGYTARRRSLIEDAKFESTILKDESLEDVWVTFSKEVKFLIKSLNFRSYLKKMGIRR